MTSELNFQLQNYIVILMKKHKKKLVELAQFMEVSESTAKRILKSHDFSIARLERIANFFSMTLLDFLNAAQLQQQKIHYLTAKQEKFLADHPQCFYFFWMLFSGSKIKDIGKKYKLSQNRIQWYLEQLKQEKIIKYEQNEQIQIQVAWPLAFIPNGALQKKFTKKAILNFSEHLYQKAEQVIESGQKNGVCLRLLPLTLPKTQYQMLIKDFMELEDKYTQLSKYYQKIETTEALKSISVLFGSNFIDIMLESGKEILQEM